MEKNAIVLLIQSHDALLLAMPTSNDEVSLYLPGSCSCTQLDKSESSAMPLWKSQSHHSIYYLNKWKDCSKTWKRLHLDTLNIVNHMSSVFFSVWCHQNPPTELFCCFLSVNLCINRETAVILMNVLKAFEIMAYESIAKNTWHQLQLIPGVQHPDQRLMNYDQF